MSAVKALNEPTHIGKSFINGASNFVQAANY